MTEHTPGPWETRKAKHQVDGAWDWAIGAEIDDGTYCIAEVVGRAAEDMWLPAEANAQLMAASPELLEALELLVEHVGRHPPVGMREDFVRNAQAAIAKAQGQ